MTLIKISEDGLRGKAVNPHLHSVAFDYVDFKSSNPWHPLTELGEPNSEVEAELIDQFSFMGKWVVNPGHLIGLEHTKVRKAWQVSKPKIETHEMKRDFANCKNSVPSCSCTEIKECFYFGGEGTEKSSATEVTEQSIEKAGKAYSRKSKMMDGNRVNIWEVDAFISGANHILTSKGMVEIDKVVEILQWHMTACSMETLMDLDQAINKIKALK